MDAPRRRRLGEEIGEASYFAWLQGVEPALR